MTVEDDMIKKMSASIERWLRNCFESGVDDSGIVGWEAKILDDKYQIVCKFKKNGEHGWWNYLDDRNELKVDEE